MKIKTALLALAMAVPAFATTVPAAPAADKYEGVAPVSAKRLSGALQIGYATNYTGRGYVVSHSVAEGDSVINTGLKLNYDFGKEKLWSMSTTFAYNVPTSGHRLYGYPYAGLNTIAGKLMDAGYDEATAMGIAQTQVGKVRTAQKNIENEFAIVTAFNYMSKSELWNVSFGHDFIHGGLLGVMAKHYRDQGASVVNEVFIHPEWTPYKWLSMGVKTSFSFQGITGWWFEPNITVKAPIVGTPDDIKVAGILTMGLTASADYFDSRYFACANGTQAFFIKLQTPWFAKENLIITPGVSFNWLGKGGIKANKRSEFKEVTENPNCIPFRNFGVVGSVSVTYTF